MLGRARKWDALNENDYESKKQTEEHPKGDQRDWSQFLYRDLDPHKGGTPDRAQQNEDDPMFNLQK